MGSYLITHPDLLLRVVRAYQRILPIVDLPPRLVYVVIELEERTAHGHVDFLTLQLIEEIIQAVFLLFNLFLLLLLQLLAFVFDCLSFDLKLLTVGQFYLCGLTLLQLILALILACIFGHTVSQNWLSLTLEPLSRQKVILYFLVYNFWFSDRLLINRSS